MADDPNSPQSALPQQLFWATPQVSNIPAAVMQYLQPQGQGAPPPQANPDLEAQMAQATQAGIQGYQASQARRADLANKLAIIQAQQRGEAALPSGEILKQPPTGWSPTFNKWDSAGHALENIGKGLLLGLSATGPGRAVEAAKYGPALRKYAGEEATLGQQAQELQKQMGSESEAQQAAGSMASRTFGAAGRYGAAVMNNQTRQAHDKMWQDIQLKKQDLDKLLATNKITEDKYKADLNQLVQAAHDRTAMSIAGMTTDQRDRDAQLQSFEQEYRINRESLLSGALGGALGILPQQPSQTPSAPPGPKARGSSVKPNAQQGAPRYRRNPTTKKVEISSDGGKTWQ